MIIMIRIIAILKRQEIIINYLVRIFLCRYSLRFISLYFFLKYLKEKSVFLYFYGDGLLFASNKHINTYLWVFICSYEYEI